MQLLTFFNTACFQSSRMSIGRPFLLHHLEIQLSSPVTICSLALPKFKGFCFLYSGPLDKILQRLLFSTMKYNSNSGWAERCQATHESQFGQEIVKLSIKYKCVKQIYGLDGKSEHHSRIDRVNIF